MRYVSRVATTHIPPQALPFPRFKDYSFFEGAPQPLVPAIRQGSQAWMAVEPLFVRPAFQRFPYFQEPPAAANLAIPFLRGQWLGDAVQPLIDRAEYQRFPYFEQPAPAPANIVLPLRLRLLTELADPTPDTLHAVPRYYPLVPPSPEAPPEPAAVNDYIVTWGRHRARR